MSHSAGGNKTKAAEWAGVSKKSFYYRLRRYGLSGATQEDEETATAEDSTTTE